jgi:uncharacterized membrane protein YebE (DUF533 family)
MQAMKNLYTYAALGLVAYLVYRQYQKNQETPEIIIELPEAPQERVSM